jgi:hypothetical protein
MFDKLDEIDWNRFLRGRAAPDISALIRGLVAEEYPVRMKSWSTLGEQLEKGYAEGNGLPLVTIPHLIDMLEYSGLPDISLITDLLVQMAAIANDPHPEPFNTRAWEIREDVCFGRNTYTRLLDNGISSSLQDDLRDLMDMCGSE